MNRKYLYFLLLYSALHITFFILQAGLGNYYLDDSMEYIQEADNILHNGIAYCGDPNQPDDPALYTKRPPAYPLFLTLARLFTEKPFPVLILQAILSFLSALLLIRIFHRDRSSWLFLSLFILFLPAQFIYSNMVMSEILFQFILMAATLMIYRYLRTRHNRYLWAYQSLLILGILVKPVLYLFVFVNLAFFMYLYFFRYRYRLLLLSAFIPVIFIIIFSGINQQRTGYFHVSSIQQINLVDYNVFFYLTDRDGVEEARKVTDDLHVTCAQNPSFKEQMECLDKGAKDILMEKPLSYGLFHLKGILRFFIDPGRFDLYNFFGLESNDGKGFLYYINTSGIKGIFEYLKTQPVLIVAWLLLIAAFNLLKTAGFLFFLFNRKYARDLRIFLFLLVGTIAFATGPLGASRFALPVSLLVLGAAAIQYQQWYLKLRKSS